MKAAVLSMEPHDAYNFLKALVAAWQSRWDLRTFKEIAPFYSILYFKSGDALHSPTLRSQKGKS